MSWKSSQNLNVTDNINSVNNSNSYNSVNSLKNVDSFNNVNSFNNVTNVTAVISDEDNQIWEWLSPLKPHQRHQDVRAERLDGVGDWVAETSEFRKWSKGEDGSLDQVLFCSGGPGVGKTYLW